MHIGQDVNAVKDSNASESKCHSWHRYAPPTHTHTQVSKSKWGGKCSLVDVICISWKKRPLVQHKKNALISRKKLKWCADRKRWIRWKRSFITRQCEIFLLGMVWDNLKKDNQWQCYVGNCNQQISIKKWIWFNSSTINL